MRKPLAAAVLLGSVALTPNAAAFCGFYVAPGDAPLYADATMVALMREGTRTALSMSNNYKGPAADFAMVVPVPVVLQKENVKTLDKGIFQKLEALSAPRLVEYWEQDPCPKPVEVEDRAYDKLVPAPMAAAAPGGGGGKGYGVKIEAQFAVGEYEVVILSASQSDGLERWLRDNKYNIPKGAAEALAPYIKEQMKFFVAKVDITKVKMDDKGVAVLSPLRVAYESQDFRLPVRLGLLNAQGKQDLIVWVLSRKGRYEVANYKNAFIPTNIDVVDDTRKAFGPFYAALFDATLEKHGNKAVVTEYAWTTSSCDPCPTPPLVDNDLATLGGDVLLGMRAAKSQDDPFGSPPGGPPSRPLGGSPGVGGMGGFYGGASQRVVLTRLHTRYDASTLTEDLVFKDAEPVVGGREFMQIASKDPSSPVYELEKGARKDAFNNFQARYAIRHPWTGPIACANPRRGVWGGPPHDPSKPHAPSSPVPATGLAAAPRGEVKLASYVQSPVAELDLKLDAPRAGSVPKVAKAAPAPSDFVGPSAPAPALVLYKDAPSDDAKRYGAFVAGFAAAGLVFALVARSKRKKP
jgi:hypothetical protein